MSRVFEEREDVPYVDKMERRGGAYIVGIRLVCALWCVNGSQVGSTSIAVIRIFAKGIRKDNDPCGGRQWVGVLGLSLSWETRIHGTGSGWRWDVTDLEQTATGDNERRQ